MPYNIFKYYSLIILKREPSLAMLIPSSGKTLFLDSNSYNFLKSHFKINSIICLSIANSKESI